MSGVSIRGIENDVTGTGYQTFIGDLAPIYVDLSASDYTPTVDVRCITSITGTVIKVDMACQNGSATGVLLPAVGALPVINITKIYKSGTDATGIYLWPRIPNKI